MKSALQILAGVLPMARGGACLCSRRPARTWNDDDRGEENKQIPEPLVYSRHHQGEN